MPNIANDKTITFSAAELARICCSEDSHLNKNNDGDDGEIGKYADPRKSPDWLIEEMVDDSNLTKIKRSISSTIKKNSLQSRIYGKSSQGNIKQYNLFGHIDKSITLSLQEKVRDCLIEHNLINSDTSLTLTNCWTCIGYKNSYHIAHNHTLTRPGGALCIDPRIISVTLYISSPLKEGDCSNPMSENHSKMHDLIAGFFYFFTKPHLINYVKPQVGKMIIFPSWIVHGTYPQISGKRQTLNLSFELDSPLLAPKINSGQTP